MTTCSIIESAADTATAHIVNLSTLPHKLNAELLSVFA
jgi:hypothetical protein